jgi:hypothetical protein
MLCQDKSGNPGAHWKKIVQTLAETDLHKTAFQLKSNLEDGGRLSSQPFRKFHSASTLIKI